MKAIQTGESGEDKVKKYESFESEVSSGNGKLDVNELANPLATAGEGLNEKPAPIKTIKQEPSPPPADTPEGSTSPKDLVTPPSSILGDIKQGSPPSDILSPQSDVSDCPPNVVSLSLPVIDDLYRLLVNCRNVLFLLCIVKYSFYSRNLLLGSSVNCQYFYCFMHTSLAVYILDFFF